MTTTGPGAAPDLELCVERLRHEAASVRRVAVLDLIRLASSALPEANAALLEHLPREGDEAGALRIVRHLGEVRYAPARSLLKAMYDDRMVPVQLAHAAILAHDRIGRAAG